MTTDSKPRGSRDRVVLRNGLLVLAAAAVAFGVLVAWLSLRKDILIDAPISLVRGHFASAPFTPNVTGHYSLQIEVPRKFPDAVANCLLGVSGARMMDNYPDGCGRTRSVVLVAWMLRGNGNIIVRSATTQRCSGGWSADSIDCIFALLSLSSGKTYSLSVDFQTDGRRLDVTNPRLQLQLAGMDYEEEVIMAQLGGMLCMLVVFVGFVMAAMGGLPLLIHRLRRQ